MEVITKNEIRLAKDGQEKRIEGYRFKLWMIERKKKNYGCKGIH